MDTVYYNGELIPASDWDYTHSKPKEQTVSKKEPKRVEVELTQEVFLP